MEGDVYKNAPKEREINSFLTWCLENGDRLFRYWIYRRMYTPFECDQAFSDESIYEDKYGTVGFIKEVLLLPDNDILLGFVNPYMCTENIEYVKLSEIRLAYCETDKERLDGNY